MVQNQDQLAFPACLRTCEEHERFSSFLYYERRSRYHNLLYSKLVTRLLSHLEVKHNRLYELAGINLVLFECLPFLPILKKIYSAFSLT